MKRNFNAGKIGMMIIFGFAAVVVLGFVIMALWNNILVPVLHVTLINYWQALGLFLLSKLLFGAWVEVAGSVATAAVQAGAGRK